MEKNEKKQIIKQELINLIEVDGMIILNKHSIPHDISNRIIKDIAIWANLIIDIDF